MNLLFFNQRPVAQAQQMLPDSRYYLLPSGELSTHLVRYKRDFDDPPIAQNFGGNEYLGFPHNEDHAFVHPATQLRVVKPDEPLIVLAPVKAKKS